MSFVSWRHFVKTSSFRSLKMRGKPLKGPIHERNGRRVIISPLSETLRYSISSLVFVVFISSFGRFGSVGLQRDRSQLLWGCRGAVPGEHDGRHPSQSVCRWTRVSRSLIRSQRFLLVKSWRFAVSEVCGEARKVPCLNDALRSGPSIKIYCIAFWQVRQK